MNSNEPVRTGRFRAIFAWLLLCLALGAFLAFQVPGLAGQGLSADNEARISDHFDGKKYFNPGVQEAPSRRALSWIWRFITGRDWSTWPPQAATLPGNAPAQRVLKGIVVTPIGHGTFLIQMDGMNILTDPIWSERCSPVSWAGPKRYQPPGLRFEDLPQIDVVLVSHNHYDHLDQPTLRRLAEKGVRRSITPLGNRELIKETGISLVDELDWWQAFRLSPDIKITMVPAQHFSARTLWDRNKALWGGFVISGPSGNVYYSGDTGYGPHIREIAKRFSPIEAALLPISPFWPPDANPAVQRRFSQVHMGPEEAVKAHVDLAAKVSIAAHFQVFQLGGDGYDDAVNGLKSALAKRNIMPSAFVAPAPGESIELCQESRELRRAAF